MAWFYLFFNLLSFLRLLRAKAFKRRTLSHPLGTPVSMAPLEKGDHFQEVEAQGSEESTRAELSLTLWLI